jgi:rRNA-processing protein FCF1
MQIAISDTSCLIDFRKASLLEAFAQLPYDLAIPDILFEQELVNFSNAEKELLERVLRIVSLSGEGVLKVQSVNRDYPALTLNDCFAFILAEQTPNCILMTGDRNLRNLATSSGIEVHGVLWGIDEMYSARSATVSQLYSALLLFEADSTVRLPRKDLTRWKERYHSFLNN